MKIYIGCDHNGTLVKDKLIKDLSSDDWEVISSKLPNHSLDDYPDFAFDIGQKVVNDNSLGILICGSGNGICIAANKVKGVRAARCFNEEDAYLARLHNNANIICFSASLPYEEVLLMVRKFINTEPSNEERHVRRVNKIINFEKAA